MLDQQQDVGHAAGERRESNALYRRPMPGGGYVEVELDAEQGADGRMARLRGRVVVERRADASRRFGHQPPVVAELLGDDMEELVADLFRLARDNAAIARGLMRLNLVRTRAD